MLAVDRAATQQVIDRHFGPGARVLSVDPLQGDRAKRIRHSRVWRVSFLDRDARRRSVILRNPVSVADGDQHIASRVRHALWQFQAFNRLPHHARAYAVGALGADGRQYDLGDVREPFILEEDVQGRDLMSDLWDGTAGDDRVHRELLACARLLREVHRRELPDGADYRRSLREYTVRYCRLLDTFPEGSEFVARHGEAVTQSGLRWYWRLRGHPERLSVIHGDFHPGNILFRDGDICVIDRKHLEYGDPNEDVAPLVVNVLVAALARHGRLTEPHVAQLSDFFAEYLRGGVNADYAEWMPPFVLTRLLVLANPDWYALEEGVRQRIWRFAAEVCELDRLAWQDLAEWFT